MGLQETVKWAHPCYMHAGRNIAIFGSLRGDFRLSFMNAGLLTDTHGVLEPQGPNSQTPSMIRFTAVGQVGKLEPVIREYLRQLMDHAEAGTKPPKVARGDRCPGRIDRRAGRRSRARRGLSRPDAGATEKLRVQPEPGQAVGHTRGADREVPRPDHRRQGRAGAVGRATPRQATSGRAASLRRRPRPRPG